MKRFTAVLCAALMVAATCVTAIAAENGSPRPPIFPPRPRPPYVQPTDGGSTPAPTTTTQSSTTTTAPAAQTAVSGTPLNVDPDPAYTTVSTSRAIVLTEAVAKDYSDGSAERKVLSLFSDGNSHDVSEIFSALGVGSATLQSKPSNSVVNLSGLEPISKPLAMKYADNGAFVEAGKLKATFAGNELTKGLADGKLFVLSVETRVNPMSVALGDASVDAQNNVTAYFQETGLQLLMKYNG